MEELKKVMQAIAAESREAASVSLALPANSSIGAILYWVANYLADNPYSILELYIHRANSEFRSTSVRVTKESMTRAVNSEEFRGMMAGFGDAGQEWLSGQVRWRVAGFGDAGQGSLPGQARFKPRKYKCPVCLRQVDGIPLDGLPAPKCQIGHPPQYMDVLE